MICNRHPLATLKRIIGGDKTSDEGPEAILELLAASYPMGWEFPEVRTVTFIDLQSSGKLALIKDARLREQLSYYYQESLHRSNRIESRITGYAAALFQIVDSGAHLVARDSKVPGATLVGDDESFDQQDAARRGRIGH